LLIFLELCRIAVSTQPIDFFGDTLNSSTRPSKRGDSYLRKLLVHGARATIRWVGLNTDRRSQWIRQLLERRGKNRTAVAVANKNARIVWALLTSHQDYQPATR
jgi:Transposase IS116/IS110/IS902 family